MTETFIHKNKWESGYAETIIVGGGAGFCELRIWDDELENAYLYGVSVQEAHRRQGYGNQLLKVAIERAHELGVKELRLSCLKDSFVAGWYARKGFAAVPSTDEDAANLVLGDKYQKFAYALHRD